MNTLKCPKVSIAVLMIHVHVKTSVKYIQLSYYKVRRYFAFSFLSLLVGRCGWFTQKSIAGIYVDLAVIDNDNMDVGHCSGLKHHLEESHMSTCISLLLLQQYLELNVQRQDRSVQYVFKTFF